MKFELHLQFSVVKNGGFEKKISDGKKWNRREEI